MDKSMKWRFRFETVAETSWHIIVLFMMLDCVTVACINLIVFPSNVLEIFPRVTAGLINETLVVNLIMIAGLVYLLMIRCGKLTWADLGMKKGRLLAGFAATVVLWLATEAINAAVSLLFSGSINWSSVWETYGFSVVIGSFIAQVFGNALFEELAFRGFLMSQIGKKIPEGRWWTVIAVLVSQALFGLIHIPNRLYMGVEPDQMLLSIIMPAVLGIFFCVIYLVTDNLFFAIGVHALINVPVNATAGLDPSLANILVTLVILAIWPYAFGKLQSDWPKA